MHFISCIKKRILTLIVFILFLTGAFGVYASYAEAAPFSGGSGTPGDPYIVATPEDLDLVRDYGSYNFKLNNDIDLTDYLASGGAGYAKWGTTGWLPVGTNTASFTGSFNGDGYAITGLWISRSYTDYVGLFGYAYGAEIRNLGVEIAAGGVTGYSYVGGLAGYNSGSIENCYATGNVTGNSSSANYVGGLVGQQDGGGIENSYATGNVRGGSEVGGLVGVSGGNITNSYATGYVSGNFSASTYVGGLVGRQDAGSIENSRATGNVSGSSQIGGLVGVSYGNITNSYATGNVAGSDSNVGGLVGYNGGGSIENCFAMGNVTGSGNAVGGLAGGNYSSGVSIKNSYATGNVSGDTRVGGLVGNNISNLGNNIENCYATGNVSGSSIVGGLVGSCYVNIINSYATGNISGSSIVGGLVGNIDSSASIANSYRYINLTLNGSVIPASDLDSAPDRRHGGVKTEVELMSKATYTSNDWLFNDSTPTAGPWYWDERSFPKLRGSAMENFPFGFDPGVPMISIITQPAPNTVVVQGSISGNLTVSASVTNGATPTYQWYRNGSIETGATSASLTIPATLTAAGSPYYFLCVVMSPGAVFVPSNTANVRVKEPTPIATAAVTVFAPETGAIPNTTASGTGNFSVGTVTWTPAHSPFQGGVQYTATVTLTANNKYTFTGLTTATINGNNATVINNTGTAATLSYIFAPTPTSITSAAVTVTAPETGAIPNTTASGAGNFSAGAVTWTPAHNPFQGSTQYTATVTLTANNNYTFTGLTTATINGNNATVTNNTGAAATLSYIFAPTPTSITSAAITVTAPATGAVPNTTASGTGNFSVGAVIWTPAHNPFQGGVQYTATVTLTANSNYTFTGLTTATINGNNATVTNNTGAAATLSYQFGSTTTPITTAAVTVTAPATGAVPNTTASGAGNFSVGAVTWTPAHNPFQGSTQYTATVTLTANNNYTFTGLTTATINGNNATVTNNTGAAATLSYQFAATFVPVTNIIDVSSETTAQTPLALTGTVSPSDATNKDIVWSVIDAGATGATISGNTLNTTASGTVTVTATIVNGTATGANYMKDFTITVNDAPVPVTGVTLNVNSTELAIGESETLTAKVEPENATNKNVTWASSAPGIATVTNGLATAVSEGNAIITAMTEDGNFLAFCNVTVTLTGGGPGEPVSSDPVYPSNEGDVSNATGIDSGNLEEIDGKVYLSNALAEAIAKGLLRVDDVNTYILPIFEGSTQSNGDVIGLKFTVKGKDFLALYPGEINLIGMTSGNTGKLLDYVDDLMDFDDGKFSVLYNDAVFDGNFLLNEDYELVVFIKDFGIFDLDGILNGKVTSSIFFASEKIVASANNGGGGCNSILSNALLLFIGLFAVKRWKR